MFEKVKDRLTKDNNKANANSAGFAPNTKIAYKPDLVSTLEEEHRQLLQLHAQILTFVKRGKTNKSQDLIAKFKNLFVDHVLKENTSLYIYLSHTTKRISKYAVKSVKAEMDIISRDVMRVLDKANQESFVISDEFIMEFEKIGKLLSKRIQSEEAFVYPNYQPGKQTYQRQNSERS